MLDVILRFISRLWYGSSDDPMNTDRAFRSGEWPKVRKQHLKSEPNCQWCGTKWALEVHHINPFHLRPELELDPTNLITLCEKPTKHCHIKRGHGGNWKGYVPTIRDDCAKRREYEKEK